MPVSWLNHIRVGVLAHVPEGSSLVKRKIMAPLSGGAHMVCWRSWLARRPVTAEVAGSSPIQTAYSFY